MTTGRVLKALFQVIFKGTEKKDKNSKHVYFLFNYVFVRHLLYSEHYSLSL